MMIFGWRPWGQDYAQSTGKQFSFLLQKMMIFGWRPGDKIMLNQLPSSSVFASEDDDIWVAAWGQNCNWQAVQFFASEDDDIAIECM